MKIYPPNFLDGGQRSPEWLKQRVGNVTASRVGDIMGRKRDGGYYQKRIDYMDELIAEILTGKATESYVTAEMEFGTEYEDEARGAYEAHTEMFVDQVGFVLHPELARVGASPDGLVGKVGGVEIKVPKTITHLRWKRAGVVPQEHKWQMLLNMDCCVHDQPREWWDFFSYDPRLKGDLGKFHVRMHRDEKELEKMRAEIVLFLDELSDELIRMTEPLSKQLERSIAAKKQFNRIHQSDEELRAELGSLEGTIVP